MEVLRTGLSWRWSNRCNPPPPLSPFVRRAMRLCWGPLLRRRCQDFSSSERHCVKKFRPLVRKEAMDTVLMSWGQEVFYSNYFLATKRTGGFRSLFNPSGTPFPHRDPQLYCPGSPSRLVDGYAGFHWHLFACANSSVPLGSIFDSESLLQWLSWQKGLFSVSTG